MSSVLLKNIATIVSGDINAPIIEGNAIFVEDGKLKKFGNESELNVPSADVTIDCAGTTVTPGLFDSHCHVVLGD
ncbi:MAG: Enamidase, partial [bacterium]|nr:Enamidase [bacterium]